MGLFPVYPNYFRQRKQSLSSLPLCRHSAMELTASSSSPPLVTLTKLGSACGPVVHFPYSAS